MSHHISPFMTASANLHRFANEAMMAAPPEVTLWFKTERDLARYCIELQRTFETTLMYTIKRDVMAVSFREFTLHGVKFNLEVEPT